MKIDTKKEAHEKALDLSRELLKKGSRRNAYFSILPSETKWIVCRNGWKIKEFHFSDARTEAIKGTIEKWKSFLEGELSFADARKNSTLCEEFLYSAAFGISNCHKCPLHIAGHGCLRSDSVFDKFTKKIDSLTLCSGLEFQKIQELGAEMLKNLEELLKDCSKDE